jgi:hypothetical protein
MGDLYEVFKCHCEEFRDVAIAPKYSGPFFPLIYSHNCP